VGRRLPPLNALRAFEAAARHLSFTRAAEELHVTQAAISHQVKALESHLGRKLFRRMNRALLLSDDGQAYLPSVTKAFELLDEATAELARKRAPGTLTVSVLPSLAARWLVPRLGRFRQRCPDVDLRIDPSIALADFRHGDVDVAIRYGRGDYPGLVADYLMTEDVFPVCSPALIEGPDGLRAPGDLARHVLLHDDGHVEWRTWLLAAGVEGVDPSRGPVFTDSSMLIQAALSGLGVALARSVLVADELTAGRLVRPFPLSLSREFAYYFVCPEDTVGQPQIAEFRAWLLEEAGTSA